MKTLSLKTSFLLLLLAAQAFIAEEAWTISGISKEGIVTRDKINTRADSTIYSPVLTKLHKGDKVKILKENFNWYKIIPPPKTIRGFVYADYIEKNKQGEYICKVNNLNIRMKPNLSSRIIGVLKKGTPLKVLGKTKSFFIIDPYPFAYSWIHKKFVRPAEKIKSKAPKSQQTAKALLGKKKEPFLITHPSKTENTPAETVIKKQGRLLKRFFSKNPCGLIYYLKSSTGKRIYLNIPKILIPEIKLFLRKKVEVAGGLQKDSAKGCEYIQVGKIAVIQ